MLARAAAAASDSRFAVAEQTNHLDEGIVGPRPVEAVRGEDPDHPIAIICGRAAEGRHLRLLADRAEAIGAVGEGLRGVCALVHLVGAIGEDRDDRAQVAGTLESLDL